MKLSEFLNVLENSEEVGITLRLHKSKKELYQAPLVIDLKEAEVVSVKTYGCAMLFVEVRE